MSRRSRHRDPAGPIRTPGSKPAVGSAAEPGTTGRRRSTSPFRLALVAGIMLAGWLVWPQITLPFSSVAPIISTLQSDSVFIEDGATVPADTAERVRETLGRRPAAMIVLAQNSAFTDRPLDICTAVADHLDDVEVMVSRVGKGFVTQCQGSDLPVLVDGDGFDAGLGSSLDRMTWMFDDDIPGQAEQLALLMDAAVKGGRLADTERTFSAPATAWLAAGGIVVAVIGGAVLLFWGVRTGGRIVMERRRRRAELTARYADVDAVVSEAALALLDIDPQDPDRTAAAARLAADYRAVLDDLEKADSVDDLASVEDRTRHILRELRGVRR